MVSIYSNVPVWSKKAASNVIVQGMCVHVAESISQSLYRYLACKTDDPDVMLWLCIRSPGYCSQVVPYAYLGILRSRLPIYKMLQCAALVLPIVLKLCSNKAQFISMLILVGINFIILKILTLCFFINSIYLYFYFQYLSTFNIRNLLLILKYSKDQIL